MEFNNKIVGIWGFGRVGQSVANFCTQKGAKIIVWNDSPLISCPYPQASSLDHLFTQCDTIVPSPGVDITPYLDRCPDKWLMELDIFQHYFTKKIVAITGTLGKTTVTTLLTQSLKDHGLRAIAAGNIGLPCLDIIQIQDQLDFAVLEVSSFQLEHCVSFAPDLALWTNFFPNHLDRHKTLDAYFLAKLSLLKNQTASQAAIVPIDIQDALKPYNLKTSIHYFSESGFKLNQKIVEAALKIITGIEHPQVSTCSLEHRLEPVTTINNIQFINDSKSTTPQSTLAALQAVSGKRIILFLGGLSKGVDRSSLIYALPKTNIIVLCFGKESVALHNVCAAQHIISYAYPTLEEAFKQCTTLMEPGDCILFSPSGSSYDLFENYEDRGRHFKQHVAQYAKLISH
jgi:UDP-N-acetylmuramoylalanine--D-glutamate ligase